MINGYTLGFVAVASLTALGMDYYNQSLLAGARLGTIGPADYAASITARIEDRRHDMAAAAAEGERKRRWKEDGQLHLPDAPEGWERRTLLEGETAAIMPAPKVSVGPPNPVLDELNAREAEKKLKKSAPNAWVYQRGGETVYVELIRRDGASLDSIMGMAVAMVNAASTGATAPGYAVVGGVGFVEKVTAKGRPRHHYREIEGIIGFSEEVAIRVHANASRASTREILEALDYDRLNALLRVPMPHVGNDTRLAGHLEERTIARRLHALRDEFIQLRAMEAEFRMGEIDPFAQALRMTPQTAWLFDAGLMSSNQPGDEVDLSALIEVGFRHASAATMQGQDVSEVAQGFAQLIREFGIAVDAGSTDEDTPTATMSPELAAEMGLAGANTGADTGASTATPKPAQPVRLSTAREGATAATQTTGGRLQLSGGKSCLNGGGRLCD
jgi:hypothetical protein